MPNALIIVDPQNDFCQGGPLGVPESSQIFYPINRLRKSVRFNYVFITQDWHPENHISFAKNHNLNPFTVKEINGKQEMLWPVHCVQNTAGAQISTLLQTNGQEIYVKKGIVQSEEQYSGFGTKQHPTQLQEHLKQLNITQVTVVGLALDYCVGNTALDAKRAGFEVSVISQCTRGVAAETSRKMLEAFKENGVLIGSLKDFTKQQEY